VGVDVLGLWHVAVSQLYILECIALSPEWLVPSLVSGVLYFVYLCGLVLFAVGLYRFGELLGDGSDAKLVRVGTVVLVPLGFLGAALAYAVLGGGSEACLAASDRGG